MVAKPLINLHVTPNGCGIFGCEHDKETYYQEEQYPYNEYENNFNTRRHQSPSKSSNFFPSSNKPKRHYQPEDYFKPSHEYPQYSHQNQRPQTFNTNKFHQQSSQYQEKNMYNNKYQTPSQSYNHKQGSQLPTVPPHRFSSNGNNGYVGANKQVKFGSDNHQAQPAQQVIRHEHYHFYENNNRPQGNGNTNNRGNVPQLTPLHEGISFGNNEYPGFLNEGPRFRSSLVAIDDSSPITPESDKSSLSSDNIEEKSSLSTKTKKKNSFMFPEGNKEPKTLNREKRDTPIPPYSLAPEPTKNIEAVRNCLSHNPQF